MNEIETLILKSLQEFLEIECITKTTSINKNNSKLVFPIKRDNTKRISEQEVRFLLVKQLEKQEQTKYLYSVESPTTKKYCFTGKKARSGNIDLCIYENGKRISLIEFKALNPRQICYSKDFEKLFCEENELENYFIQVIENTNSRTIQNIENKYRKAIETVKNKHTILLSILKIYICDFGKKNIIKYEVNKNGELSKIRCTNR